MGIIYVKYGFEKHRHCPHTIIVLAWESCRNRNSIEQMPEKKAESPGVLSM